MALIRYFIKIKKIFRIKRDFSLLFFLLGVLCVSISFPFSFQLCTLCKYILVDSYEQTQFVYYLILVIVFQFGWAASQISHLSLIPDLTNDETQRVSLNTIRYSKLVRFINFLILSNILKFLNQFKDMLQM